jgi:hypothetical protein
MSTQNISREATKLKKLAKASARYMEMEEFKTQIIIQDISVIIVCTLSGQIIVP